jgi:hypothetical protein
MIYNGMEQKRGQFTPVELLNTIGKQNYITYSSAQSNKWTVFGGFTKSKLIPRFSHWLLLLPKRIFVVLLMDTLHMQAPEK